MDYYQSIWSFWIFITWSLLRFYTSILTKLLDYIHLHVYLKQFCQSYLKLLPSLSGYYQVFFLCITQLTITTKFLLLIIIFSLHNHNHRISNTFCSVYKRYNVFMCIEEAIVISENNCHIVYKYFNCYACCCITFCKSMLCTIFNYMRSLEHLV